MKRYFLALSVFGCLLANAGHASQDDLAAEKKRVLDATQMTGEVAAKNLNEMIEFSGIDAEEVFDIIEKRLSTEMADKNKAEEMAWLAKTLALSGNKKYQNTLIAARDKSNSKLKDHSIIALARLDQFAQYNPILRKNLQAAPAGGLERQRVLNALESELPDLVRWGAKRVFFALYMDRGLVQTSFATLKTMLPKAKSDDEIDAVAWLIKGVGAYGAAEEKDFIRQIIADKNNDYPKKIIKYAKISLK